MPTQQRPVQDVLLADASLQLVNEDADYIADLLFTERMSKPNAGVFGALGNEHLRIESDLAGGKAKYTEVTSNSKNSLPYNILKHGLAGTVTEEDFDNSQQPFDARLDESTTLTSKLKLGRERAMADVLNDSSIFNGGANSATPSILWDVFATSDPAGDTLAARLAIKKSSGKAPDTVIISWETLQVLRQHPQVLSRFVNVIAGEAGASDEQVKLFLNVKTMHIGMVTENSAKEGQADDLTPVWTNNVIYIVSPDRAIKNQITFAYTFKLLSVGKGIRVFHTPQSNPPKSEEITVDLAFDDVVTNGGKAGFLLEGVTT